MRLQNVNLSQTLSSQSQAKFTDLFLEAVNQECRRDGKVKYYDPSSESYANTDTGICLAADINKFTGGKKTVPQKDFEAFAKEYNLLLITNFLKDKNNASFARWFQNLPEIDAEILAGIAHTVIAQIDAVSFSDNEQEITKVAYNERKFNPEGSGKEDSTYFPYSIDLTTIDGALTIREEKTYRDYLNDPRAGNIALQSSYLGFLRKLLPEKDLNESPAYINAKSELDDLINNRNRTQENHSKGLTRRP